MIIDHLSFDVSCLRYWTSNYYLTENWLTEVSDWVFDYWWDGTPRLILRLTVICVFFCISGICSSFSRHNGIRSLKIAVAAVVVSLVTLILDNLFDLGISILFGVLHCFTVCTFIYAVLDHFIGDKAKYAFLGLGILFFVWGLLLDFYNLQGDPQYDLSYRTVDFADYLRIAVGTRYYGSDCFGILPYCGIFLIGAFGGHNLYKYKREYLPLFSKKPFAPIRFIGKKAVWFYLLHQPVIFAVVMLLAAACGLRLAY